MAASCCDDLSLTTENSVDSVCSSDAAQQVQSSAESQLACVFCDVAAAAATHCLKVLPCLHVACQLCLTQFLSDLSPGHNDVNFAASIFACPRCLYSLQLPCDGVVGLSDAAFLQSAGTEWLTNGHSGTPPLSAHTDSCKSLDDNVNNTSLPYSHSDHSQHVGPSLNYQENSSRGDAETLQAAAANSDVVSDDGERRAETRDVSKVRRRIGRLSADALRRWRDCEQVIEQAGQAARDLDARSAALRGRISARADSLCELVRARCSQLVGEVEREHQRSSAECSARIDELRAHSRCLLDTRQFADALLAAAPAHSAAAPAAAAGNAADDGDDDDDGASDASDNADAAADGGGALPGQLAAVVAARLTQLLLSDTLARRDVTVMRLDAPDPRQDDTLVDRLFGGVVTGALAGSGGVQRVTSFHTALQWPAGFAVLPGGGGAVLAGKTGAFADAGHVLFYDRHGACVDRRALPGARLPVGVVGAGAEHVLVSDIAGHLLKYAASGRLVADWADMFDAPGGHMAVSRAGDVLVTSAGGRLHRYDVLTGERLSTVSLHWPDAVTPGKDSGTTADVTAIAVNSRDELLVTARDRASGPCVFGADGRLLDAGGAVRVGLASSLCCDAFDNVLIADFLGNCVHVLTGAGLALGHLLSKARGGVACPVFTTLDQHGRLYVGQYGGDVAVFRYLSQVKHA